MNQYRSKIRATLPSASDAAVSGVRLPEGELVIPDEKLAYSTQESDKAVLWISKERADRVGEMFLSLAAGFQGHGLWPLVLTSLEDDDSRPWLSGELDPSSSTDPAQHDATTVLKEWWANAVPLEEEEDDAFAALVPFGRSFPGLAPSPESTGALPPVRTVVGELSGRLGLVAVQRPADAAAVVGWQGPVNYFDDMGPLAAVLRSWEDRFSAVVVGMGFDTLTLAVGRPPTTLAAAHVVAAEHFAVCSDNVNQGSGSIHEYAAELVGASCWTFWWD